MKKGPTLITLVKRLQRERGLWSPGAHLLCACSGGPDSTAALHALAWLRDDFGHRVSAVGVDHGLRQGALAELEGAARLSEQLGISFEVRTVSVTPGPNLQARAREARHGSLQAVAQARRADGIVLGHTADDRAETVLMRLMRGSGLRGLAVMPPRAAGLGGPFPLLRPLLLARRTDVLAHLERHGVAWSEDPSNRDPQFFRSRVRSEILPRLEALSPRVVDHLNRLAAELNDDVFDAGDDPWADMTRGQREALAHAVRSGRSGTKVRLAGGRDVELRFSRSHTSGTRAEPSGPREDDVSPAKRKNCADT